MVSDLLLSYYGDDLTGSTDVMEAMETRGVPTVLFTGIPTSEQVAQFPGRKAFGIAGTSRSETPAWMNENLPAVFEWLKQSGAEICHYKVCSTFDSSPDVGSIGSALDIGAEVFDQTCTPLVIGAPELRRYTAFGNLFAHFGPDFYRIDRHPVMSRHPVTPMHEGDMRLHLARQTEKTIGLVDFVRLKSGITADELERIAKTCGVLLFDVIDEESKAAVGSHLWEMRQRCRFVVGSSGVEYALVAKNSNTPLSGSVRTFSPPGTKGPILVVSGSCSPTTESQIRYAFSRGFVGIEVDAIALVAGNTAVVNMVAEAASKVLVQGLSPLLYTALGPVPEEGANVGGHAIGRGLGRLAATLVERHGLQRVAVAGGDTSSHAIKELDIYALQCCTPLRGSPGSPLCTAYRGGTALEIAFKGGQVGTEDYFLLVRDT